MRKKTKIVATISDRNCSVEFIKELRRAGMNVVRLNTAHQSHEDSLKVIQNVRQVSERIAILLDTKGPEIRTTKATEPIPVTHGQIVHMKGGPDQITTPECIYVSYEDFANDVPVGSRILIDDGDIELIVREKKDDYLVCEVRNDGKIQGKKSVNIPSVHVKLPTLSKKDIEYIYFAIEHDLDFIAHSFVRKKEDVIAIQNILDEKKSNIKIISKIENQEGVDNIDEILDHSYGIMVARGDLAVEIPQEQIPVIQKMLINKSIARRKPVITATQMLHTMITNPRPTRAEVSDVANAIFDGTDAIMLSGETAYGEYPIRAVEMMNKIALQVEAHKEPIKQTPYLVINNEVSSLLAISAVNASLELKTEAIIADTETGRTIRALAAYRGRNIIFAQCYSKRVMRELGLTYGVFVNYMEKGSSHDEFIFHALQSLKKKNNLKETDLVVVLGGNFGSLHGASFMEIGSVENMVKKTQKGFADWRAR